MNKSDSIASLAAALVKAQRNIGGAVKGTANPFFKSKFAGLGEVIAVCKAALLDEDISVSQMPCVLPSGAPGLETILLHSSGEWMSGVISVICAKANDPQAMGSAYTYARRYALQSTLLIPAVDDDAEAAMYRAEETNSLAAGGEKNGEASGKGQPPKHARGNSGPGGSPAQPSPVADALADSSLLEQLVGWQKEAGIPDDKFIAFLRQAKKQSGAPWLRENQRIGQLTGGEVQNILDSWSKIEAAYIKWSAPGPKKTFTPPKESDDDIPF